MDSTQELDRKVAEALGYREHSLSSSIWVPPGEMPIRKDRFTPSINGQQAMDLVREFDINLSPGNDMSHEEYSEDVKWRAVKTFTKDGEWREVFEYGPTPEIAICLAVIAANK